MSSKNIVLATTLAPGLGQDQWEPQPLQYECPELQWLHLEQWTCGRTVENTLSGTVALEMVGASSGESATIKSNSSPKCAPRVERETRAWKLFLLAPRMLLTRPPRGGKVARAKLVEHCAAFARGEWIHAESGNTASR